MSDIESFSRVAGYLYEVKVSPSGNTAKAGSCFFVHTDLDAYLVTAQHVAKNCSLNTKITYNLKDYNHVTYNLKDIIQDKSKLNWTVHPEADVAVVLLDSIIARKNMPVFPIEYIESKLEAPKREDEVTVFGFPLNLGVRKKFSAISKTSKPSSGLIELKRPDGQMNIFYLLDDPGVRGFSGGPVIQLYPSIGGITISSDVKKFNRIIGLVHGSIGDINTGGGFTAIVPSRYIVETINMATGFTGIFKYYYPNGELWSEVEYQNGSPYSVINNYNSLSQEQDKGTLKKGNGTRIIYDENSQIIIVISYKNGIVVSTEYK